MNFKNMHPSSWWDFQIIDVINNNYFILFNEEYQLPKLEWLRSSTTFLSNINQYEKFLSTELMKVCYHALNNQCFLFQQATVVVIEE